MSAPVSPTPAGRPLLLAKQLSELEIPGRNDKPTIFETFLQDLIQSKISFQRSIDEAPAGHHLKKAVFAPLSIENAHTLLRIITDMKNGGAKPSDDDLRKAYASMKELVRMFEFESQMFAKGLKEAVIEKHDLSEGESWKDGIDPVSHQQMVDQADDAVRDRVEMVFHQAQGRYENLMRAQLLFEKLAESLGVSLDAPGQSPPAAGR